MSTPGSHSTQEMLELLNRHLDGQTSPEERRQVEEYLAAHPDAAQEFGEMEKARDLVRRAVAGEPVPESLHGTILHATIDADAGSEIDFGLGTIITLPEAESGRMRSWYYAAAVVLLLLAGWFVLQRYTGNEGAGSAGGIAEETIPVDSAVDPVMQILRIGMTDHLKCAVAHYQGHDQGETREAMRAALGEEFVGLLPIADNCLVKGGLVAAHRCAIGGRNYVHLILKEERRMISIAITHKRRDESLAGRNGVAATASAIPVYRAAMDGFEVAGFETGEFFVFVASNLPEKENIQFALNVAEPVSQVLKDGVVL